MAEVQPDILSRLPRWLAWYLEYGLEGKNKRERRSQLMCNWIMGLAMLSSFAHVTGFLLLGRAYWPASLVALAIGFSFLLAPRLFDLWPSFTALFGTALLNGLFSLQTFLLGTESETHVYMYLTPVFWLAILGASRPLLLGVLTLIAIGFVLVCLTFFETPALHLPFYENYVFASRTMVVSWTIILILVVGYLAFSRAERAEDALEAEHARSEALLYNLLPTEIAARLKDAPDQTIADSLDHTAILFADIVDFTPRSAKMTPEALVEFLNRIFSTFDQLATKHGLEKIKTIGDAYMVAAGLPQPVDRPVHRVAEMAFDMLAALRDLSADLNDPIEIRIGLHAGPVVAGVIGHQKLFYDVWGDTVNTASRMESHGQPGRIQVTAAAREALKDAYDFEPRGPVEIKGIGALETWWLTDRATSA